MKFSKTIPLKSENKKASKTFDDVRVCQKYVKSCRERLVAAYQKVSKVS
jgi:hypothetical protein